MASALKDICPGRQSPEAHMGGSWGISALFLWLDVVIPRVLTEPCTLLGLPN